MSSHAYSDKKRTQIITATKEKNVKSVNKLFYCLNPECNAKLQLKASSSNIIKKPYFSALPSKPHIQNCWVTNLNEGFNETNYNPDLFVLDEVVNEYMTGNFIKNTKRLSTISGIYHMCKTKSINTIYGDSKVFKILCDNRSNQIYSKNIQGSHLIECKYFSYDSKSKHITFKYPLDTTLKNIYTLKVFIPDEKLFNEIRNSVYNKSDYSIIVVGDWKKEASIFKTTITNKFQIYFP